jgi:hypothetical protein
MVGIFSCSLIILATFGCSAAVFLREVNQSAGIAYSLQALPHWVVVHMRMIW